MTRDEFKILVKAMKAVYTDPKFIPDQEAFDVWYGLLGDLDYRVATAAVKKHMMTSRFAPAISEIREEYAEIQMGDEMTGMEAWSLVSKAIRNSGYHSKEEFDKLPEDVQRAVGSAHQLFVWGMDESFNESVVMSQFMKSYQQAISQRKEQERISADIKRLMKNATLELEG